MITANFRENAELVPSDFRLLVKGRKCRGQLISELAEAPFLTRDDSALAYERATTRRADIATANTCESQATEQKRAYRDTQHLLVI